MRLPALWMCLCLPWSALAADPAAAQDGGHGRERRVTTEYRVRAGTAALGAAYRKDLDDAMRAALDGDFAGASATLERIAAACASYARPGLRLVAAHDADEYARFVAESGDGTPVDWLDMACPGTLKAIAFVLVESGGDRDLALQRLDQAISLAPYWADPYVERGYLLAHTGRLQEGLASYREAIRLAEASGKDPATLAMGWRGVGYALGELQDWPGARAAYRRSLEVEPGNALARNELDWIDAQDPAGAQPAH